MKPEAWTKMHPGMPVTPLRSSSRTPRQASGSGLRLTKESLDSGTHWIRHLAAGLGFSRYRTGVLDGEEVILPRRRKQVVAVKDEQASLGIVTEAVRVGASDDGSGGQPGTETVVELALKLLADAGAGDEEAFVLHLLRRLGVFGGRQDGRRITTAARVKPDRLKRGTMEAAFRAAGS
ncbi:hypothetical protein CP532_6326 [Ophiocordyceps camponoti-leonardi (nom. inval.)]|nr:hypothetical protein CP532_6326 [Ophiocordyceps camponoti-leonardi (nom. inval.)]